MAKILVADDNSNVQKTVSLALADLGFEVVAVNNGDAAVKRLAEFAPDLVLADIFMPVRNGYEVCEFVKKDSRFAHVPVVLLVGAFDPLDEREAQRVGADGILKKPFVPPDPLITMVKTLLERSRSNRSASAAASKPAISPQKKTNVEVVHSATPEAFDEIPLEEARLPLNALSFGEGGERPIAFGQLLDSPEQKPEPLAPVILQPADDDQVLTSSRDASLGDPVFWKPKEPEIEPEDENENENEKSEAEADIPAELSARARVADQEAPPSRAKDNFLQPAVPLDLVRDEQDASSSSTISVASILQDPASQATLSVNAGKPEDLAANPTDWMATVTSPPAENVPEAIEEESEIVTEDADHTPTGAATGFLEISSEPLELESSDAIIAPVMISDPVPPTILVQPQATIDNPTPYAIETQSAPEPAEKTIEDPALSFPKGDWAELAASLLPKPVEPAAEIAKPSPVSVSIPAPVAQAPVAQPPDVQSPAVSAEPPAAPDPALIEAVVQRIMDKMRPAVQDLVQREIDKK